MKKEFTLLLLPRSRRGRVTACYRVPDDGGTGAAAGRPLNRVPDDGGTGAAAGRPLKSGSDFSTDFTIPHPSGMPTTSHAMQSIGRFDWPDCREGSPGAGW
jgi:hypothetical protein